MLKIILSIKPYLETSNEERVIVYTGGSCGVITRTTQCIQVGLQQCLFGANNATALSKATESTQFCVTMVFFLS